jgi:hypothetical protein
MVDDWVKKYVNSYKQRQQQKQQEQANAQKRAELAEAQAPDIFQRIRDRIEHDIRRCHDTEAFRDLQIVEKYEDGEFTVSYTAQPSTAVLNVKLSRVIIGYAYLFSPKGKAPEEKCGSLRIAAELEGEAKIYKNGDTFADEVEISEFFLTPLLKYIERVENS